MTEAFSNIVLEVYTGAWVDIWPDVQVSPSPRMTGMGLSGHSITDRIGNAAQFIFTLDNSENNSHATLGYYTPGGTNVMTGWAPRIPIRVGFTYDGQTRYKFYGRINRDGIKVDAGRYGPRKVNVTCSNWFSDAANAKLSLLPYLTNKTFPEAVQYILDRMTVQPRQVLYSTGTQTFPDVFDTISADTKAIGEINKLTWSEFGYAYVIGDGSDGETLFIEGHDYRSTTFPLLTQASQIPAKQSDITDYLLQEDGTNLLLEDGTNILLEATQSATFTEAEIEDMTVSYGSGMYTRAKFVIYPRKVDAAATTVLYTLESPIKILSGETLTEIRTQYRDPNGANTKINALPDTCSTVYAMFANEDGTGTDYSASLNATPEYGTAEARHTFQNNAGVDAWITQVTITGKGIYVYDTQDKVYDSPNQNTYGVIDLNIDLKYTDSTTTLFNLADKTTSIWQNLLNQVNTPLRKVDALKLQANRSSKHMLAFLFLEPPMQILVDNTITAGSGGLSPSYLFAYNINGYSWEIINKEYVNVTYILKLTGTF